MINNNLSDYLVESNIAKCYKPRYINKIMLFFEFQKGGLTPETPLLGTALITMHQH